MSEAKRKDEWDRCSFLLAEIHNAFLANPKDAIAPADRNPFTEKKEQSSSGIRVSNPGFKKAFSRVRHRRK